MATAGSSGLIEIYTTCPGNTSDASVELTGFYREVELFLQLEREFGIAVDPTDLDIADFQSVASIGSWVSDKQAKARAASG